MCLTMNGIGHRWHRCDRFSQIVVNYPKSVFARVCGQFFMFIFVVSVKFITFVFQFWHYSGGVRKDFIEKVLLKLLIYIF